jgi:hypothetical protein
LNKSSRGFKEFWVNIFMIKKKNGQGGRENAKNEDFFLKSLFFSFRLYVKLFTQLFGSEENNLNIYKAITHILE